MSEEKPPPGIRLPDPDPSFERERQEALREFGNAAIELATQDAMKIIRLQAALRAQRTRHHEWIMAFGNWLRKLELDEAGSGKAARLSFREHLKELFPDPAYSEELIFELEAAAGEKPRT